MTEAHLKELLKEGEGLTVEFKECTNSLNNSVYETVSSFSNRYGGHLLLGVDDDGNVLGVNPKCVIDIQKNFANMVNNPQKISPTLYLGLEKLVIDDKIVLYVHIPISSQVIKCGGRIFDRNEDADIDITDSVELSANLYNRKSLFFTEHEIFPYATLEHLRLDLIPKVKQMALIYNSAHLWKDLSDMEFFRSAGLYEENVKTSEKGFNLAAILLFGRDEIIRSCAPGYTTDALLRRDNLDRYDDRLIVETNLIEAYDQLMDFIAKHTLDRFFLVDNQRVSVRSWIARELVSNILVHRDYASSFPAKIIITQDRIYAENWNRSNLYGRIDPNNFTPQPKNPLLASFFVNIGRADKLGSGVRNLYKYTKIYSGGEPELIEGDVFKTIVPLQSISTDKLTDMTDKLTDILTTAEKEFYADLVIYFQSNEWIDNSSARDISQKSPASIKRYLTRLAEVGILEPSGENKGRKYRLKK